MFATQSTCSRHAALGRRSENATTSPATSTPSPASPTAWIDWDAVMTALVSGRLPSSGGEKRILQIAASLAVGHPVNLRDTIPGLDRRNAGLIVTAVRHAAGQRPGTRSA
jgi:hypothetical protein